MKGRDWKCSDPDALELLRAEASGASEDAKERVLRHLAGTLGVAPTGSSDPPEPPPGVHRAARSGASLGASAVRPFGSTLGHPAALALSFALGGGAGAAAYATLGPSASPAVVYVQSPARTNGVPASSANPPAGDTEIERPGAGSVLAPDAAAPRSVASGAAPGPVRRTGLADLASQQALLDGARASFGRGENEAALRAIAVHERRYPDSALSEEREALAIKALAADGRASEARARGARFIERYPRSLLVPAVEDCLEAIR